MTSVTDVCNRALQTLGTRTTVTDAEIATNGSNEAIQFNLIYAELRDDLLRRAPWDCATKTANLTYISSVPGTPENTSPATPLWTPGQPAPPWAYEYQYPVDCLRACRIIPANQTGYASGVPITTAVTGGAAAFWRGQPVVFKIHNDAFYPVISALPSSGGSNYVVGDIVTLATGLTTNPPIGAPAQVQVAAVSGGVITAATVVNVINGEAIPQGGSYFAPQVNPVPQGTTTGAGVNAQFILTYGAQSDQRVILTNQEFATLAYVRQVVDPNVWDPLFRVGLYSLIGAHLAVAITGDKKRANDLLQITNQKIDLARSIDGNEGLTINDVTPDWIRIRGVAYTEGYMSGPYSGFDWGEAFPAW